MIYFIENGQDGHIKIGYAKAPEKRLKELQTGTPYPLKILKTIEGDRKAEQAFHTVFGYCRVKGEWFKPDQKLKAFIENEYHNISESESGLKGKWFHNFKADGNIKNQGQIISVDKDHVICQLYSWISGGPTNQQAFDRQDVTGWNLYDTDREMVEYYHRRFGKGNTTTAMEKWDYQKRFFS